MADIREALRVGRDSEGGLVRRPVSPHLQVYRPQITSVLSIFHRVSGVWNAVGTLLLVWWLVAAALGADAYAGVQGFVGSPIGLVVLFSWTVALFYHFFAGLRHLAWDAGFGFEKAEYAASGYAVLIAAAGGSVLAWVVGLILWLSR